jgi:hypothetical protein
MTHPAPHPAQQPEEGPHAFIQWFHTRYVREKFMIEPAVRSP